MEEIVLPLTCKECKYVLFNITEVHYCGHDIIHNDARLKNRSLEDFISANVLPNFCPLKALKEEM